MRSGPIAKAIFLLLFVLNCTVFGQVAGFPGPRPPGRNLPPPKKMAPDRFGERALLPEVTVVQRWRELGIISGRDNFAPGIVSLPEGGYRVYWNNGIRGGVLSAFSRDGREFLLDDGFRLFNGPPESRDAMVSHPWVVQVPGGFRMYYQANAETRHHLPPEFRIMSAFSKDSMIFRREGVCIDIGPRTGLFLAGHGRTIRLSDGSFRMVFSGNRIGERGPSGIIGASSGDGVNWIIDNGTILEKGHDPALAFHEGELIMVCSYLRDNLLLLESVDEGRTFEPVYWLEFFDPAGNRIEEFGDVELFLNHDGELTLIGSGKGSPGLGLYQKIE